MFYYFLPTPSHRKIPHESPVIPIFLLPENPKSLLYRNEGFKATIELEQAMKMRGLVLLFKNLIKIWCTSVRSICQQLCFSLRETGAPCGKRSDMLLDLDGDVMASWVPWELPGVFHCLCPYQDPTLWSESMMLLFSIRELLWTFQTIPTHARQ